MFGFKDLFEEYIKLQVPDIHELYDGRILFCPRKDCDVCTVLHRCYSHPLKLEGRRPVITEVEVFKLQYPEYFV